MKNRIIVFALAVSLSLSAWGCTDKDSSSDKKSGTTPSASEERDASTEEIPPEVTEDPSESAAVADIKTSGSYSMKSERFTFAMPEGMEECDDPEEIGADVAFKLADKTFMVGTLESCDMHESASTFVGAVMNEYEEQFTDVSGEEFMNDIQPVMDSIEFK